MSSRPRPVADGYSGGGDGADRNPHPSSSPPAAATGSSPSSYPRRTSSSVVVTHLSNFAVVGSSINQGSCNTISHAASRSKSRLSFNKERYVFANFRFVIREARRRELEASDCGKSLQRFNRPIPWQAIELVLVPAVLTNELLLPTCPICLGSFVAPKLTRCGHAYCWPCILQYVAHDSTALTSPPATRRGQWRRCPVCFETMHPKQLMSVQFYPINGEPETEDLNCPFEFVLLRRPANSTAVYPVGLGKATSPFEKIIVKSDDYIRQEIVGEELKQLRERLLESCQTGQDDQAAFLEEALMMASEREALLASYSSLPLPEEAIRFWVETSSPSSPTTPEMYFHQSSDGQALFLHPFSIKMLRNHFGPSYASFPPILKVPVLAVEHEVMTAELGKRYKHVNHLPIGCHFGLCEVDLSGIVSEECVALFEIEINERANQRFLTRERDDALKAAADAIIEHEPEYLERPSATTVLRYGEEPIELQSLDSFPVLGSGAERTKVSPPQSVASYRGAISPPQKSVDCSLSPSTTKSMGHRRRKNGSGKVINTFSLSGTRSVSDDC